jgi:hypothetical protein
MAGVIVFSVVVLEFVDRFTVDSFTPRPEDVPAIPEGVAEFSRRHGGHDVRGLLHLIEEGRLYMPGESSVTELAELEGTCRLVLHAGIGTENARRLRAVGVKTIGDLALWKSDELVTALEGLEERGWSPRPSRVRIWVGSARDVYARGGA